MDKLHALIGHADVILILLTSLVTLASIISAGTTTPRKGSMLYKLYHIIEMIGLVVGKAKQDGETKPKEVEVKPKEAEDKKDK